MGIPAGVSRVVFFGQLAGGDIWQCGYFVNKTASSVSEAGTFAGVAQTTFNVGSAGHSFYEMKTRMWATGTTWTGVNFYSYNDASGKATYVGQASAGSFSASYAILAPDQTAMVITTKTAHSGKSFRGRIYTPATRGLALPTGLFQDADVLAVLTGWAADIDQYKTAIAGGTPVVVSSKLSLATPMVALSADARPDIQRRRANRQARGTQQTVTL